MSFLVQTTPLRSLVRCSARRPIAIPSTRSLSLTPLRSSPSKIDSIVDSISTLTLLEAAELVTALKSKLNITEISMPAASAAPAAGGGGAAAAEEEVEKPKEQTAFNVKLEKFDPASKAKVIREVKALMSNMNLVEAKKFVESVPQVVKENLTKEDAETLKQKFMDLGCTVVLV